MSKVPRDALRQQASSTERVRRQMLLLGGGALLGLTSVRASAAKAAPSEISGDIPDARLQGSARLRFLGLQVYDVRLWSGSSPVAVDWAALPLALELEYLRSLPGSQIAERSLKEMQRQGEIAAETAERWLSVMKKMFPDVSKGDRLTGVSLPGQGARLFFNGALRGDIREPDFARLFFGIWLSPRTSEPAIRQALLGSALGGSR